MKTTSYIKHLKSKYVRFFVLLLSIWSEMTFSSLAAYVVEDDITVFSKELFMKQAVLQIYIVYGKNIIYNTLSYIQCEAIRSHQFENGPFP